MAAKRGKSEAENSDGEVVVQLATRIPKTLQKRLKLHSVQENISISDFVSEAIEAYLDASGASGKRGRKSKAEKEAA